MDDEPIQVQCYAGALGDETPRAVMQGGRRREVRVVRRRWIEEGLDSAGGRRRWFRVVLQDGGQATIYCDLALDMWFLRHPEAVGREADGGLPAGE